ncbi:RNase P modulator RnpM [Chloroflexota bacterium]
MKLMEMRKSLKTCSAKNIPQRTCVACREVKAKQELVRLVRVSDTSIEADTGGNKPGRGAYLCRVKECWENGINNNRLEYTLRTTLTQENREQLIRIGENLIKG